jgi:glucose/arabinose dehydrogenase
VLGHPNTLGGVRSTIALALIAVLLSACGSGADPDPHASVTPVPAATASGQAESFAVVRIATGFNRPTWAGGAPGDPESLWVLEQPGRIVRVRDGRRETLLDMTGSVKTGAEQGMLGIAFHPDFMSNGRLFLHWSDLQGDTRVAEFAMKGDGSAIRPQPVRELLHVEQPEPNHNGGQLAFGPDQRLHLGLGDGGGAFDPRRTAQDPKSLLGKLIAVDVDAAEPHWEIVLIGLRNPWRFSFDLALGEVWIADVGQDQIEEVDRVLLEPEEPPKNLGWSAFEGDRRVTEEGDHELAGGDLVWPAAQYTHEEGGCSVTGGYVYHGTRIPALQGRYVYGDFCSGKLWTLRGKAGGGATDVRTEAAAVPQLTHIGPDGDGEPVLASATGAIYRATSP